MKEWARNDPPSAIAALFAVMVTLEVLLLGGKTGAALAAFDGITDDEKKVEAFGKLISAIGLLAAAPVGVTGVALAFWRSWSQHRDGLTAIRKLDAEAYAKAAEAFAKAVEQLGHDKSSIRMGAALALEALGKSTPRFLSQTIEILCAYVRETRPVSPTAPMGEVMAKGPVPPPPTDIQLILDIVNRLKWKDPDNRIGLDLSRVDLRMANLSRFDLRGANLGMTNLSKADLSKADLTKANLRGASLSEADLRKAKLNGVNLTRANLNEADLSGANLSEADLRKANLGGAILSEASLSEAILSGVDLSEAVLSKADLSRAFLIGADMNRTSLVRADVSGAYLKEANLREANLSGADLTNTTFKDTILPNGLVWTGKGPPPDLAPAPPP